MQRILVWDVPTRLFHWLLAITFAGAWITSESERWRDVHVSLGYTFGALLLFRLLWGVAGSRYARFSDFVKGPASVLRYLRSLVSTRPEHHVGHNPAGGWAVMALLALGLITAGSGLLAYSDVFAKATEELHEGAASAMLALVMVHIAAVFLSSLLHGENLVRAMVNGYKRGEAAHGIRRAGWVAGMALVAGVITVWVGASQGSLPGTGAETVAARSAHDDDHDEDHD
jgi:cytochrome b